MRAVHEANWMSEMEISIYDSWFNPAISWWPGLIPDAFIYLRASPDTCHKRMMLRKRAEEGGVSLDYLRDLHEKHENWLFPSESGNHGVLSVSKLPHLVDCSLHPDIRDRVFYLEGDHMHSSIQKVIFICSLKSILTSIKTHSSSLTKSLYLTLEIICKMFLCLLWIGSCLGSRL